MPEVTATISAYADYVCDGGFFFDFESVFSRSLSQIVEVPPRQKKFDLEDKSSEEMRKFRATVLDYVEYLSRPHPELQPPMIVVHPEMLDVIMKETGWPTLEVDSVPKQSTVKFYEKLPDKTKAKRVRLSGRRKRKTERVQSQVDGLRTRKKEYLTCNRGKHNRRPS